MKESEFTSSCVFRLCLASICLMSSVLENPFEQHFIKWHWSYFRLDRSRYVPEGKIWQLDTVKWSQDLTSLILLQTALTCRYSANRYPIVAFHTLTDRYTVLSHAVIYVPLWPLYVKSAMCFLSRLSVNIWPLRASFMLLLDPFSAALVFWAQQHLTWEQLGRGMQRGNIDRNKPGKWPLEYF